MNWRPIDDVARAAGEVLIHRLGQYRWDAPCLGTWLVQPDGFKGWFNREGEYLGPATHYKLPNGAH